MRRPLRLTASLAPLAFLAGACSGGSSAPDAAAIEPNRSDRLVVMLSDLSDDDLTALELVGDEIDLVLVEDSGGECLLEASVDALATCDTGDLTRAVAHTSGPVVLIAAAPLERVARLDAALLERLHVFSAAPVDDELAAGVSSVTNVPAGVGGEIADHIEEAIGRRPAAVEIPQLAAVLIGIDDTIATFEVVETPTSVQRAVTGVSPDRVGSLLHTGAASPDDSAAADLATVPSPELLWSVDVDPRAVAWHSRSAVVGSRLYVLGFDGLVRSLDRLTGDAEWFADLSDGLRRDFASIVVGDPSVVVTATRPGAPQVPGRNGVVAFDPPTGGELWRMEPEGEGFGGHPLLAGGAVFFWWYLGDDDSAFMSVDAMSGDLRWRTEAMAGRGQGLLRDGIVYVGSGDGTLYGFDAASGAVVFEFSSPASAVGFGVASRPATADGVLYFGSDDGVFHAVDIATAEQVWEFNQGTINLPSSPVVADDLVIFGGFDNAVHALDRLTGESVWRTPTDSFILSSPALLGESVAVVGTGSHVDGLDVMSGALLWRHDAQGLVTDSPLVVDDVVYIQTPVAIEAIRPAAAG